MPVYYTDSLKGILPSQLQGFFVDWPNPPDPETHLKILQNSQEVIVAVDAETQQVVGFINALSDGVLMAYLPLLEVLPAYQDQGIGRELLRRMLEKLRNLYAIDLVCDEDLSVFYEKAGFRRGRAMLLREYRNQSGRS